MDDGYMIEVDWDVPPNRPDLPRRVGPFESNDEAIRWGELNISNAEWSVQPLVTPYLLNAQLSARKERHEISKPAGTDA